MPFWYRHTASGQRRWRKGRLLCVGLWLLGLLWPQRLIIPVAGASEADWHPDSFWYYPWGSSITHKGIDIFSEKNTPVLAATDGWVLGRGTLTKGGNFLLVLGPKWRLHYYAHLDAYQVSWFQPIRRGQHIATVGNSGNAQGKPPHLHYSLMSLLPLPWRIDGARQGWLKMVFLNPLDHFP